jgi:hydroxyethylthiazole kinase-like sugar kinase family protein
VFPNSSPQPNSILNLRTPTGCAMTSIVSFARRQNRDSSIDSICTKCFQTVASAQSESELAVSDQSHVCNPNWMFTDHSVGIQRIGV